MKARLGATFVQIGREGAIGRIDHGDGGTESLPGQIGSYIRLRDDLTPT
ncbi:MAG: hypothetical protein U1E41_05530 [Paracoccus sp. (in: a-proteobacteria)]|jgi:hypothetical protein